VAEQTNLLQLYDLFYIRYLRYLLSEAMCQEYDIDFAPNKMAKLRQIEQKLLYVSPPDYSMRKIRFLNSQQPFNWARVNISPGWTVS